MSQDTDDFEATGSGPTRVKELLLDDAVETLAPLIRLWLSNGIGFTEISKALRSGFIDLAEQELETHHRKATDAAVSLLSGVHRKEVKSHRSDRHATTAHNESDKELSYAEQVFTKWSTDAAYLTTEGKPATLAVGGPAPSFETLVSAITRDFSKRTVLDELLRLGLVSEADEMVTPLSEGMVPKSGVIDLAKYFHQHVRDHLAAGAANLLAVSKEEKAPFLEHSMYVNGISDASIEMLSHLAKTQWKQVFDASVNAAQQRYNIDQQHEHRGRLRFGVYIFSEPSRPDTTAPAPSKRKK
jgi:Family of unknown function (DUF6502)